MVNGMWCELRIYVYIAQDCMCVSFLMSAAQSYVSLYSFFPFLWRGGVGGGGVLCCCLGTPGAVGIFVCVCVRGRGGGEEEGVKTVQERETEREREQKHIKKVKVYDCKNILWN